MVKNLIILGSTGSVGTQALEICNEHNIEVELLVAGSNIELLEQQIRKYKPKYAAVFNENLAKELQSSIIDIDCEVFGGALGIEQAIKQTSSNMVLNAIVGISGLKPTITSIQCNKHIALANKETLVVAGDQVKALAKSKGVSIIPVDSEHSAIFQCLQNTKKPYNDIKKLIITASGGPFFGKTIEDLQNITPEMALKHPNWSMGAKITIDSATMFNKSLEIIEAVHLFDIDVNNIEVVIHRESIIHSMVEFIDTAVLAQLGLPDMKVPIQYALSYPERVVLSEERLDLTKIGNLTFFEPDCKTFRSMVLAREAIKNGGIMPAVLNSANEQAVEMFLNKQISFLQITNVVELALNKFENKFDIDFDYLLELDINVRKYVKSQ